MEDEVTTKLTKKETATRRLVNRYATLDQQKKDAELAMKKIRAKFVEMGEGLYHGTRHTIKVSYGERTNIDMEAARAYWGDDFLDDFTSDPTEYTRVGLTNKKEMNK